MPRGATWVTPARVLAVLYATNGLLCLLGAARPVDASTPVGLVQWLAAVGLVGAVALWVVDQRLPRSVLHGALALKWLMLALLASQVVTGVGVVGLGPGLICVGLYAAYFLDPGAARVHVALALTAYLLGAWASGLDQILVPCMVNVAATVGVTHVQGHLVDRLRRGALTDPLTGLANRTAWHRLSETEVARAGRDRSSLTVAIIDLDDFKAVNDRHGHIAGDVLLRDLAVAWQAQLRPGDHLARFGGDEFVLMLPGTDEPLAARVLQRLRHSHPVAWSAGTATWRYGETVDSLLLRADVALYAAKGRRSTAVPLQRTQA